MLSLKPSILAAVVLVVCLAGCSVGAPPMSGDGTSGNSSGDGSIDPSDAIPTSVSGADFQGLSASSGDDTEMLSWWRRTADCSGDNLPPLSDGTFYLFIGSKSSAAINGHVVPIPAELVDVVAARVADCAGTAGVPIESGAIGTTTYYQANAGYIGYVAVVNGVLVQGGDQPADSPTGFDIFSSIVTALQ